MDATDEAHSSASRRQQVVPGAFDISGAIDLHIHSAPCLFPRVGDDLEIASASRAAGMRAIAFKSHHESTVSRGYHTMRSVPGLTVLGGITLNWPVGGINPAAVETALMLGGRIVWGPSGHSEYHARVTGTPGKWGAPGMEMPARPGRGVTVLDGQGHLTGEAVEVLDLVRQHDALFCTAHLSPEEIRAVLQYSRPRKIRVLVNHVFYFPRVGLDVVREIVELGGWIELITAIALPSTPHFGVDYTFERVHETIRVVGPERIVISTDGGGAVFGLWPHEQLRWFAQNLVSGGVPASQIREMIAANPARLVGLE
ncbi:MAG: hypothetical protein HY690_19800 [Chloroflexi bacterium]|nr:hypothetical protein [Chloroflexota bacterium]